MALGKKNSGTIGSNTVILGNLGVVHRSLGKFAPAIDCHRRALEIERKRGVEASIAHALANLGATYYTVGSLPEALKVTTEAVADADAQVVALSATVKGGVYNNNIEV